MRQYLPSIEIFIAEWNASNSIDELCEKLQIKKKTACTRCSELRDLGFNLKRWVKIREFHGEFGTRLYKIWASMLNRCRNSKCKDFPDYGGRGITVCDEWASSYLAFRKWADSTGYQEPLTIDRIDGNLGYCPQNCRWATQSQQNMNKPKRKSKTTSKYKGVCLAKEGRKWIASISVNRSLEILGRFESEIEAAKAYDVAAKEKFGEFALLNFQETLQVEA